MGSSSNQCYLSEERLQRFSPKKRSRHPPRRGPRPLYKTLLPCSSAAIGPSGIPRTLGGRCWDRFVRRGEPYPEAHARLSRPIRDGVQLVGSSTAREADLRYPLALTAAARAARHPCQGARAARDGRGPLLSAAATCCHGAVHGPGHLCDPGTGALSAPPDSASVCRSSARW